MLRTRVGSFPHYYCQERGRGGKSKRSFLNTRQQHTCLTSVGSQPSGTTTTTQLHFEIFYTWPDRYEKSHLDIRQEFEENLAGEKLFLPSSIPQHFQWSGRAFDSKGSWWRRGEAIALYLPLRLDSTAAAQQILHDGRAHGWKASGIPMLKPSV